MDRSEKQKMNRPILKPSRSSHARMQFAGFGCGAPPPRRRKNIPKAERSKVLHDAEQLVRVVAHKEEGKDRAAVNKIVQEHSNTSDKYKFMLEKPWRTGNAFHEEDESSNSNVKGKINDFKVKDPKSFTTETPVAHTKNIRDTQPTKVIRKASRDEEGIFDDIATSNNSLGFQEEIIDNSKDFEQKEDEISVLKEAMSKKESEHEVELKRVVNEQQNLVKLAQEALEQAQLSAEAKMRSLERKLADVTKQETQRQEALTKWKSKSDMIENQLAQVELDRRMEVSSLQKKLANSEELILELNQRMVDMVPIEDLEERMRSSLEEFEEKLRLRETTLETELTKLRDENERIETEFCAMRTQNELLTEKEINKENDHEHELAAKIARLEEELIYSEARHVEALGKANEEKETFAKQVDILQQERQKFQDRMEELANSVYEDQKTSLDSDAELHTKVGELWERLSTAESQLEMEHANALHLEKENAVLMEKLNAVGENNRAFVQKEAYCGMKDKVESLEKQLVAAFEDLDQAKSNNSELMVQNERMQELMKENEPNCGMKDKVESLEKQLVVASEDLDQAKSKNSELMVQNERMQELMKVNEQSQKAEISKKDIVISDLESNIKVVEKLLKETKQQLETAQEKCHEVNHVEKKLESKEKQIDDFKKLHERLKQDFEKLSRQEALVKQELNEASNRHRNEVDELEAEIRRSNVRIDELEREISSLIPVSQEVGRVKLSLHDITEEWRTSKSENESLHGQIAGLRNEISNLNSTIRGLESDLNDANRRHEDTASHLANLESAQAKEQEILSEELRESENTIACLMEEIDQMQSIASDLQITRTELKKAVGENVELENNLEALRRSRERELGEMQTTLEEANQQVLELREQLLPMTKELQQTKREMEELQCRMEQGDDGGKREALRQLEEENSSLRRELEVSAAALELSENQLASFRRNKENEFHDINDEIGRSREAIVQLQSEVNLLRPKVLLLDRKEQECASLSADLVAKEKQIDMCRLQLQDIEEERNYSRARIAELDDLLQKSGISHSLLEDKANEVAGLKAERDTLRQKLNVVEAFATALEEDNNQKKELVREMLSKSGENGGLSATEMIERLQKDLERTLKRCADLSLQLADSQFHIDQLTEEIRQTKKTTDISTDRKFKRSGSYESPNRTVSRKSISSMFANSISAMDESLRGVTNSMHGKKSLP